MRSPFPPHHEISTWRLVLGIILVIAGLLGVLLPMLPGWVLFFIGLALLGIGSSAFAARLKRTLHIEEIDLERIQRMEVKEEIGKLPLVYRHGAFGLLVLLQALVIVMSAAAYRDYLDAEFVPFLSASRTLLYLFPSAVFLLGVGGLYAASVWKPKGTDLEHDFWETYFNIEVVGFPLFWAFVLLLNVL